MPDFRWFCWQGSPTQTAIPMGDFGNLWRRLQVNHGDGWRDIPCVWQTVAEQQAERDKLAKKQESA